MEKDMHIFVWLP